MRASRDDVQCKGYCHSMIRPLLAALLFAAPVSAKTLTWSFNADVQTLDPHVSHVSFTNAFLTNVYETLVRMDDHLVIEPALATAWEQTAPTVWRFHLRPGVHFHDGGAFTADDVVFSWARLNTPGANRGAMGEVSAIRAPDPATVEIETARPFPILLNALLQFPIMSRTWSTANGAAAASDLNAQAENYATRHENGTGPFRLVSRQPEGPTVLEAFPGWWEDAAPQPGPRHLRAHPQRRDPHGQPGQRRHRRHRGAAAAGRGPRARLAGPAGGAGAGAADDLHRHGPVPRRAALQRREGPQPAEGPARAGRRCIARSTSARSIG